MLARKQDVLVISPRRGAGADVFRIVAVLALGGIATVGCGTSASSAGTGGRSGGETGGVGGAASGGRDGSAAGAAGSGVGEGGIGGHGGGSGAAGGGAGARGGNGGAGATGGSGGSGSGGTGGVAGAGGGAGGGGAGGTSLVVWAPDATKAVVEDDGGGLPGPAPAGSTCNYGVGTYTFTVADDLLAWHYCDSGALMSGVPYKFVDGSRVLTAEERDMLVTALEAVVPSTRTNCGADKSERLLTITRPSGTMPYHDDFYACRASGVYVHGIDAVFSVAGTLAR